MAKKYPRFIALCGNPKAGKSLAQEILSKEYNYLPVDDGHVLRDFAVRNLGMTWDQVSSQAGKNEKIDILGKEWERRKLLGGLGNHLEDMFGDHIMPYIATRNLYPNARYSFGSVRKTQGHFYRGIGGAVIEIMNPQAPETGNDFDRYDLTAVHRTVINDGQLKFDDPEEAKAYFRAKLMAAVEIIADEFGDAN